MIENPLESRQTNRLAQLEAEIEWPIAVGPKLVEYAKEHHLEQYPTYIRIGAIMGEESSILQEKFSRDWLPYVRSSEDRKVLSQLISGYAEVFDIIFEAELIDASDNQFDVSYMSALEQAEIHLRGNSIWKLVREDSTGVKLLEQNKTMIKASNFPEGFKRGFARGLDRYMQILNYLQE